jgi:hypothetical protein
MALGIAQVGELIAHLAGDGALEHFLSCQVDCAKLSSSDDFNRLEIRSVDLTVEQVPSGHLHMGSERASSEGIKMQISE